jgi:hypothetical protein
MNRSNETKPQGRRPQEADRKNFDFKIRFPFDVQVATKRFQYLKGGQS